MCGKSFARVDNLKRHMLVHTKVKNHICPSCNKALARPGDLMRHKQNVHDGARAQRSYKCKTCGEAFTNMAPFHARVKNTYQPDKRVSNEEGMLLLLTIKYYYYCYYFIYHHFIIVNIT